MPKISFVCMVKNEEQNLHRLLPTIKTIAHEIVIVDTGSTDSTDSTKAYCTKMGARVIDFPLVWTPDIFALGKNKGIEEAANDWIMICDADEEFSAPLLENVRYTVNQQEYNCLWATKVTFHLDRPSWIGKAYVLFNRCKGKFVKTADFHADIQGNLVVKNTDSALYHFGWLFNAEEKKQKYNLTTIDSKL